MTSIEKNFFNRCHRLHTYCFVILVPENELKGVRHMKRKKIFIVLLATLILVSPLRAGGVYTTSIQVYDFGPLGPPLP